MIIQIECTALQLKTISEALRMFDYSLIDNRKVRNGGWALACICDDWITKEKELKEEKRNNV